MSRFLVAACSAALILLAIAPAPTRAARWDLYSNANLLNSVTATSGGIWCASDFGVHRFDPASRSFTRFAKEPGKLASNAVSEIETDAAGNTWFATRDRGVSVLTTHGEWRALSEFNGVPSDVVTALEPSAVGMWIGTDKGLALFDNFEVTALWPDGVNPSPFASDVMNDIAIAGDSTWIATPAGPYVTKSDEGVVWTLRTLGLPPGAPVRSMAVLGSEVWCVANGAVYRGGETGTWSAFGTGMSGTAVSIRAFGNELLAGTNAGVFRSIGGAAWTALGSGFPTNVAVDFDPAGGYWAGNIDGLWSWNATSLSWQLYRSAGPNGNWVQGMALEGSKLYIATRDGGVSRFTAGSWRSFGPRFGASPDTTLLSQDFIFGMFVDSQGRKWAGDWGGSTARFRDTTEPPAFEHFYEPGEPDYDERNSFVWSTGEDPLGNVWLGLDTRSLGAIIPKGLNRISPNDARANFSPQDGAPMLSNHVRAITFAPGPAFEMWVGYAQAGVNIFYDPNLIQTPDIIIENPTSPNGLIDDDVWGIQFHGDSVWVATSSGLSMFSRSTLIRREHLGTQGPSTQGAVHPLSLGADGSVWWVNKSGVFHRKRDRTVEVFTVDNSPLTSSDVHSVIADHATGDVWIGTVAGLHRYNADAVPEGGGGPAVPSTFQVYPNPASQSSGGVVIRAVDVSGPFTGKVYNVMGKEIVAKLLGNATNGIIWSGVDDFGVPVPPGLYFLQVTQNGLTRTSRVVLFR